MAQQRLHNVHLRLHSLAVVMVTDQDISFFYRVILANTYEQWTDPVRKTVFVCNHLSFQAPPQPSTLPDESPMVRTAAMGSIEAKNFIRSVIAPRER